MNLQEFGREVAKFEGAIAEGKQLNRRDRDLAWLVEGQWLSEEEIRTVHYPEVMAALDEELHASILNALAREAQWLGSASMPAYWGAGYRRNRPILVCSEELSVDGRGDCIAF